MSFQAPASAVRTVASTGDPDSSGAPVLAGTRATHAPASSWAPLVHGVPGSRRAPPGALTRSVWFDATIVSRPEASSTPTSMPVWTPSPSPDRENDGPYDALAVGQGTRLDALARNS